MVAVRRRIGESQRGLLDDLVSCRQPVLVLAKVLFPRGDPEDLDEAIAVFSIPVQLPSGRAGSESGEPELIHRSQELGLTLRCDGEVDGDEHGSGIGFGVEGHPRVVPIDRWLRI